MREKNTNSINLTYFYVPLLLLVLLASFIAFSPISAHALLKWQVSYKKSLGLLKSKKYDSALKEAKKALKENKNPYTLELNGNILQFLKRFKLSNHYFKKSLAYAVFNASKKSSSDKRIDKFISMAKNNIGLNYLLIGNYLLKENKTENALNSYKKGLAYANAKRLKNMLMLNSAIGYEKISKFKLARNYAKKVIVNSPKNPFAYFIMGRAEYGLNELDLAAENFKSAVGLLPSNKIFKKALKTAEEKIRAINKSNKKNVSGIKKNLRNLFK